MPPPKGVPTLSSPVPMWKQWLSGKPTSPPPVGVRGHAIVKPSCSSMPRLLLLLLLPPPTPPWPPRPPHPLQPLLPLPLLRHASGLAPALSHLQMVEFWRNFGDFQFTIIQGRRCGLPYHAISSSSNRLHYDDPVHHHGSGSYLVFPSCLFQSSLKGSHY